MILRSRAFCSAPLSRTLKTQVRISRLFIVTGAIFLPADRNFASVSVCRAIVLPLPLPKGEEMHFANGKHL
jgi:hypothetical protein